MTSPDDIYFSVPGVATVRWDGEHKTVFVEWDGWANTAEFTALLDAEVTALHEHQCSRLLADCRRQRILNPADQERADREGTPRAIEAGAKTFLIDPPPRERAAGPLQG